MPETSAGILMYRGQQPDVEVLLAHPGGPFWRHRDAGAWTIPKGLIESGETPEHGARREFEEEMGAPADGPVRPLGRIRQRSGKWVEAFALRGDFDPRQLRSNLFELEWPPRGGTIQQFPEVDRAQWFGLDEAKRRLLPAQTPLLERLAALLQQDG